MPVGTGEDMRLKSTRRRCAAVMAAVVWTLPVATGLAKNGTFLDRELPADLRVTQYNVHVDSIFSDVDPARAARFARLAASINADVWNFQEIYNHTAAQ